MSVYDLEEKENQASQKAEGKNAESEERNSLDNDSDNPWVLKGKLEKSSDADDSGKFYFTGKINKRKALISGGLATVLIGGTIGISGFLSGPLQFIQFSKLLERFHFSNNQEFSDGRVGKLIRWARTTNSAEDRNLSRTGTKIAKHYEAKLRAKGIEFEYNRGRLSAISVDPTTEEGKKFLQNVADEFEIDTDSIPPDGNKNGNKRLVFAENSSEITNTGTRRKLVKSAVKSVGMNKVSSSMASRILKARAAVDFHPLKNLSLSADERLRLRFDEFVKKVQDQRAKSIENGSEDTKIKKLGGEDPENPANAADNADASSGNATTGELETIAKDPDLTPEAKFSGVKGKLAAGFGVVGAVATVCGVQAIGDASAQLQESNIVQPLIRTGVNVMSIGSQIQSGNDVNFDELGALSGSLYNKEDKSSWMSAESIQAELGRPNTGVRMPDSAKPGRDKPAFFKVVDGIAGVLPCKQINSTIGGLALTIGSIVIASGGPISALVNGATEVAQDRLVNFFLDDLIRFLAGPALEVAGAAGGTFGNYANFGAFLASNNTMKGLGGRALTNQERVALNTERIKNERKDMAKKPLLARLTDPYEPNSLLSRAVIQNQALTNPQESIASILQAPLKGFSAIGSLFKSFSPAIMAASEPYDYGVDQFGFSLDEINNPNLEDPYKNANEIEPKLAELNEKYGKECFGTTIDPQTGALQFSKAPSYQELEQRKNTCGSSNKDQDFLKYRMLIADTVSAATITCFESIDDSACSQIGVENTKADPNQSSANTGTVSGDAKSLASTILQNTKISKDGSAKQQLESIAAGNGPCPSVNGGQYTINPELLRIIASLGQNNTFSISSLHRGCTNSSVGAGRASRHWQGKAVDIGGAAGINGVKIPSFDAYDGSGTITNFLKQAAALLPANCELGVPNSRYQSDVKSTNPACQKIFLDTPGTTGATGPHVHIGVP